MKHFFLIVIIALMTNTSIQQGDKTITLTVSGQGNTRDEAKQNALRNAIELAFGTFISSNTAILNNDLVKDEIVSISNGNIIDFKILSELETPDGGWANIVKTVVSVTQLTSFCENKGIAVEFKGGLFAIHVKQQQFNEENEIKSLDNMCKVLKEIQNKSFNFKIRVTEPTKTADDIYSVPITVYVKSNENFSKIYNYLNSNLKGLSMSKEEIEQYKKMNKSFYTLALILSSFENNNDCSLNIYYVRTKESFQKIIELIYSFKSSLLSFELSNGYENKTGDDILNERNLVDGSYRDGFKWKDDIIFFDELNSFEGSMGGFTPIYRFNIRYAGKNRLSILSNSFITKGNPARGQPDWIDLNDYKVTKGCLFPKPTVGAQNRDYSTGEYHDFTDLQKKRLDFIKKYFPKLLCTGHRKIGSEDIEYSQILRDAVISFDRNSVNMQGYVLIFKFMDHLSLDDISKITEYKVSPIF